MRPVRCVPSKLDTPCVEWTGALTPSGYGKRKWQRKMTAQHRLVFFWVHGRWPEVCRHKCDNPPCFNPEHLEDGTHADNARDKHERGRANHYYGEAAPLSKLTNDLVWSICERVMSGETRVSVAASLGVHVATVEGIVQGRSWKHAPRPPSAPDESEVP